MGAGVAFGYTPLQTRPRLQFAQKGYRDLLGISDRKQIARQPSLCGSSLAAVRHLNHPDEQKMSIYSTKSPGAPDSTYHNVSATAELIL